MALFRDLSILWSLFHVLILFMLLYRSRYTRRKTLFLTGITMGPLILLNVAGVIILGTEIMGKIFLLTCTLPSFLFFWFVSKDKKGRFFFTFCLTDTVALWILAGTNVLDFYFGGEQHILIFIVRLFMFPLVEWCAVRYLRKPYMELQESVAKGWGLFTGMMALYYLLLSVKTFFPVNIVYRPQELPAFVLIMALMPMTYATVLLSLYRQLLLHRKQQSERSLSEQKRSLEMQLENQQQIRKLKHDMKGHTVTLSGLLAAGKTEEAVSYLKNMESGMETVLRPFCANSYLNSVFNHYSQKFQELEAGLRLDIQVGEEALPYMELCQILSNGLENAWEAVKELSAGEREVSVQMKYKGDYLLIRIKNKCRSDLLVEKGTVPQSGKSEPGHGFGLSTIEEAAKRLDGEMLCYTDNGNFVLDVMVSCRSFKSR